MKQYAVCKEIIQIFDSYEEAKDFVNYLYHRSVV